MMTCMHCHALARQHPHEQVWQDALAAREQPQEGRPHHLRLALQTQQTARPHEHPNEDFDRNPEYYLVKRGD